MKNLRPENVTTVWEALCAGADFEMLCAVRVLYAACIEISDTGKIDLIKLGELGNIFATIPSFQERLRENVLAFSKQYPELSLEKMAEELKGMLGDIDVGDMSQRLKNLQGRVSE